MSAIFLNDEIIHYEVLGRGRPVIFLHGWVGSWRYWIPTMQVVSNGYRAYALELWGFGDTSKNADLYSLEFQQQLLFGFLESLGILRVVLVGHGLGAVLALNYARQYPDAVDRVLAVAYPMNGRGINHRLRSDSPDILADWLLGRNSLTEPVRLDAPKTDRIAISRSLDDLSTLDLKRDWQNTCIPNLLVYGQNDPVVQIPALEVQMNIPECSHIVLFEQSGHFPMLDESNQFGRLLLDFLELKSGESPAQLQLKEQWKRRVR